MKGDVRPMKGAVCVGKGLTGVGRGGVIICSLELMGVKTELGAGVCRVKGEGGTTFPSVIQVGGVVVGDDW